MGKDGEGAADEGGRAFESNVSLRNPKGDLPALGFFTTSASIGIGDPFVKKRVPDPREVGKQLQTSPTKHGQTGDNWGGKTHALRRLFEGDQYVDPGMLDRKARVESTKKNLTPNGFVPSSPPKKQTGLGGYDGCLGSVYEYQPQGAPPKGKPKHEPRQIVTSPPKKGSFGYNKVLIGRDPPYYPDPFDAPREQEKEERQSHLKKRAGGAFKATSHPLDFFDSYPKVAASKVYTRDIDLPPPKEAPHTLPPIGKPFMPSHTPLQGFNSTFESFPEYKESPYNGELIKRLETEHESKKKVIGPNWKPSSTPKSTLQSSILTRNVTYNTVAFSNTI